MSTVCSIFSPVLKPIPCGDFDAAVRQHQAERNARGFTSWGRLAAMLFCRLGSVTSLRDITNGLAARAGRLRHLGLPAAPKRSTPADANSHRPGALFEDLLQGLLETARRQAQQKRAWCTSSASRTSCCRLTPPPSSGALRSSTGRSSAAPRAPSSCIRCSIKLAVPVFIRISSALLATDLYVVTIFRWACQEIRAQALST